MRLENLRHDLTYAIRGLRARPGFTIAVAATLALGIGANAAMFGIVDRLLFRPPPMLKDPDTAHRVYIFRQFRGSEFASSSMQYARFLDLSRWTTSFSATAAHAARDLAVGTGQDAHEMRIGAVSASFFGFFDAPPALGRYFTDEEDQPPQGTAVAVLSYPMWQQQYGGRTDILGTTIHIGSVIYTIIGVAPQGFVGLWSDRPPAAYIPIATYEPPFGISGLRRSWWETYTWTWAQMIARRRPDVTPVAATTDLTTALLRSIEAERAENTGMPPTEQLRPRALAGSILSERGPTASNVAKVATWVGGMSLIVLLIACANVANLLLARALRRRREIAVRLALGVSRMRLASQLFTESVLLALVGGAAGLLIAHWGGAALRAFLLERSEAAGALRDGRTLAYAAIATVGVGLLTGLAPVLQAWRAKLTSDLKAGNREGTYARSYTRLALLVLQGTLSVILLVGAGLFVRSLQNVRSTRLGYDVDPILVVDRQMRGETLDSAQTAQLHERLLEAARSVPGVVDASHRVGVPFWTTWQTSLYVAGIDSVSRLGQFSLNPVSPSYFATMGTRILRGRGISDEDRAGAPRVMVVSEGMAKALWPGQDPIGQCVRVGSDTVPCTTVVGVAEDIRSASLGPDSTYYYYLSAAQRWNQNAGLFVRTRGDSRAFVETVRQRLQREMPGASYVTVTPFREIVGRQTRSWELGATMFVIFGALALVLAAIGLYSVIAYNVSQRTHELGVRAALGARGRDLVRLVVRDGLRVVGLGVVAGAAVALWAGRWVEPLLFQVSPRDPWVYGTVVLALVSVAVAASWAPARRASRVDPNVALRTD